MSFFTEASPTIGTLSILNGATLEVDATLQEDADHDQDLDLADFAEFQILF